VGQGGLGVAAGGVAGPHRPELCHTRQHGVADLHGGWMVRGSGVSAYRQPRLGFPQVEQLDEMERSVPLPPMRIRPDPQRQRRVPRMWNADHLERQRRMKPRRLHPPAIHEEPGFGRYAGAASYRGPAFPASTRAAVPGGLETALAALALGKASPRDDFTARLRPAPRWQGSRRERSIFTDSNLSDMLATCPMPSLRRPAPRCGDGYSPFPFVPGQQTGRRETP
jgi:hypothetical protein